MEMAEDDFRENWILEFIVLLPGYVPYDCDGYWFHAEHLRYLNFCSQFVEKNFQIYIMDA